MNNRILRLALLRLQTKGRVAVSQFTSSQRAALDEFAKQTGAVRCERQGRGDVYCINDQSVFDIHLLNLAPDYLNSIDTHLPQRAQRIAHARSSKAGNHQHDNYYPILKAVGENVCWYNDENHRQLPLSQLTRDFGSTSLTISATDGWYTPQVLWLVENQALFDHTEWLPKDSQVSLVYYAGQIDGRLLNWLSSRPRAQKVVHFADYDAVGLSNFTRLYARLGDECSFWLIPDWPKKLARYGNPKLWQDNLDQFLNLKENVPEYVQSLMRQMTQLGLALEQEAVWLDGGDV